MSSPYSLVTSYVGQGLLNGFSFFTGSDPSHGFVNYQGKANAIAAGLVSVDSSNVVKLGVDSVNQYTTHDAGRPSVRITSYAGYTHGLFIGDFQHMPASTCGVWPAFWTFNNAQNGANWPAGGEVDIIEGGNTAQRNAFSAHTTSGCNLPSSGFTGQQQSTSCGPSSDNVGCNYAAPSADNTSYGDTFNAGGGGVYAMQWESDGIKLWHFPRSNVPSNIKSAPDPTKWGTPHALFGGSGCNTDTFFYNMSIVIDINLCGDYAGNIWGVKDKCNQLASTCVAYVAGNPKAFAQSYWSVNYISVWQRPHIAAPQSNGKHKFKGPEILAKKGIPMPELPRNILRTPTETRTVTLALASPYPIPTQSGDSLGSPSAGEKYNILGCFSSGTSYETWSETADLPTMNNEACVASCASHKYAGVFNTTCYCANSLGDVSLVANSRCNLPCEGSRHETCGGLVDYSSYNKTMPFDHKSSPASANILLTVLRNLAVKVEPAPMTITTAVTVTYTTVCATNAAKLVELEYGTTLTIERPVTGKSSGIVAANTNAATTPWIPMATRTEMCDGCGPKGESSVTLTVPKAVLTAGPDLVVTALTVATVVPINPHGASEAQKPVIAGASGKSLGIAGVVGWMIVIWLSVFGAIAIL